MEKIIIGILVLLAVSYVVVTIRNSLKRPQCSRDTEENCSLGEEDGACDSCPFSSSCDVMLKTGKK